MDHTDHKGRRLVQFYAGGKVKAASGGSSDHWIEDAVKRPGAFSAKAKKAGVSTSKYADEKKGAPGRLGKEARLANTLSSIRKKKGGRAKEPKKMALGGLPPGVGAPSNPMEGRLTTGIVKPQMGRVRRRMPTLGMPAVGALGRVG